MASAASSVSQVHIIRGCTTTTTGFTNGGFEKLGKAEDAYLWLGFGNTARKMTSCTPVGARLHFGAAVRTGRQLWATTLCNSWHDGNHAELSSPGPSSLTCPSRPPEPRSEARMMSSFYPSHLTLDFISTIMSASQPVLGLSLRPAPSGFYRSG